MYVNHRSGHLVRVCCFLPIKAFSSYSAECSCASSQVSLSSGMSVLLKISPYHLDIRNIFPLRAIFRYKYTEFLLQKDLK